MKKKIKKVLACFVGMALLSMAAADVSRADEKAAADAKTAVERAEGTLSNFMADPEMGWFRSNVKNAQGLFIVPRLVKAGFIFGGSGGTGVLMARGEKGGQWSYPAFLSMGSGTFGFAAGVEVAEVMLLVMTKKGMDAMLSTQFKLGGDVSVAVGPVGAGAKAQTADILAFTRAKGLYGGISVEGAVITPRDALNKAYYGSDVRTSDILITQKVKNPHADNLIRKLSGAGE